jgi:single-strand DNA-binding protein
MQQVTLIGNVGKDAELRTTNAGTTMAKFSVATSERHGGEEKTEWWNVTVFGKSAENAARLVTKGRQVFVQGRLELREYEQNGVKRMSLDVACDKWELCGGGDRPQQRGEQYRPPPAARAPVEPRRSQQTSFDAPAEQSWDSGANPDDDIPF